MTARSFEYAQHHPDIGFAVFMDRVDRTVIARTGLSVFDFADAPWAELFEEHGHCGVTDEIIFNCLADADDLFAQHMPSMTL